MKTANSSDIASRESRFPVSREAADTVYALSSGRGRAAIALVRLSGPASRDTVKALCGRLPEPRRATARTLREPGSGQPIDHALVLWLPGPDSFTGEDMAEFHVHGGTAVVAALFRVLRELPGLRAAERGEFSRRAVENGRMSLIDAEGVADLIDAETEVQRAQAFRQASGRLDTLYEAWRTQLLGMLAHLEAHIDFVDEEDVPPDVAADVRLRAGALAGEIATHLNDDRVGERIREGFTVVLAGPPNAGKSSLLNYLAKRDVAIVSDRPGTTRDVIEVPLDLAGYPVVLVDTAGLRGGVTDEIEDEGMRRARDRAARSSLVLWVTSPDTAGKPDFDSATIRVLNKCDLLAEGEVPDSGVIHVSARTGEGIDRLLSAMTDHIENLFAGVQDRPIITRERHRAALSACVAHLRQAEGAEIPELVADDLRHATDHLGRAVGRIDIEEVLGEIFSEFCIGK